MHLRVSTLCGHFIPPKRGAVCVRERCWKPPPHDLVHVLHLPKYGVTMQSFGQCCELQLRASFWCGQALPPFLGAMLVRSRTW